MALISVVSAARYDNLLECSFAPFVARLPVPPRLGRRTVPEELLRVLAGLRLLVPVFDVVCLGPLGALASFYVACRWKSTPHATWLASYAFFSAGLFMGTGLILRYLLGEHPLWDKGYALTADLPLWPVTFLVLSGCYATLFRTSTSLLPPSKMRQ